MNATSSFIYTILEWITRFAYANLLWIVFTLAGGIIFGLFPATIALFAVCRDWARGDTDKPLFASFWQFYKQDFLKSNLLGLFVAAVAVIVAVDILYIQSISDEALNWTIVPLFAFMLLFLLFLFYLFPTFVHFDISVWQVIKNSFLIMLVNPFKSFLILACLVPLFFILQAVPAVAFIFGAVIYAFTTMWFSLLAFEPKQKSFTEPG